MKREKGAAIPWKLMQDMSINEQEKEGALLIENSDYSEYSLLNVRGMDVAAQGTEPEEAKKLWSCLKS